MYFYTTPLRGFFRQRGHRLFLKCFLYKRWLLNATSRREVSHCRPIMSEVCTVCACAVFYSPYCCPDLTGSLQWIQIVIFISILERICTKEKKRYSPPQPCSLWFLHQGRTSCFCFILHRQMWHVGCWHFGYNSMDVWVCACDCVCVCEWVCKFMEVILCKLLPQFFLEKITSINENIFSFFYKRCCCLVSFFFVWLLYFVKQNTDSADQKKAE